MEEKMFKIEKLRDGNMIQSGKSALRALNGKEINKVNILVREVIQNSLDAKREDAKFVKIEIFEDKFNNKEFTNLFEEIGDVLYKKYEDKEIEFIAFKDSNTKGLTGPIHKEEERINQEEERLINLVYSLGAEQLQPGAGGSWGYGKTALYNFGKGLVLFYTRIKEEGEYKSRLIGVVIENPNKSMENKLITNTNVMNNKGIAWFGEKKEYKYDGNIINKVIPICDEEKIKKVLNIFNIEPYIGTDTGTTTIIPYINVEDIMKECKTSDDVNEDCYWFSNNGGYELEDYIKICISRWYTFRLNNYELKNNPYLEVYYNNEKYEEEENIFYILKKMYKLSNTNETKVILDNITYNIVDIKIAPKKTLVGKYIYTKITIDDLGGESSQYDPFIYFFDDNKESDREIKKIGLFCRKPGMIVNYEYSKSEWLKGVETLENEDEYFIGLFVLNSEQKYKVGNRDVNLEEYVRGLEGAEHSEWVDKDILTVKVGDYDENIDISKINLIKKIFKEIKIILKSEFEVKKEVEIRNLSSISKKFSHLLLPTIGYGRGVNPKTQGSNNKNEEYGSSVSGKNKIVMQKFYNDGISMKKKIDLYVDKKGMRLVPKIDGDKIFTINEYYKNTSIIPFKVLGLKIDTIVFKNNTSISLENCYVKETRKKYEDEHVYLQANFDERIGNILTFDIKRLNDKIDFFEAEIEYKHLEESCRIILDSEKICDDNKEENYEE